MRRLHLQFYFAILATLAVFVVAGAVFAGLTGAMRNGDWGAATAARIVEQLVPPASGTPAEQQQALGVLQRKLDMGLSLYDRDGQPLATAGDMPVLSPRQVMDSGWALSHGSAVWVLPLPDGRRVVLRHPPLHQRFGWRVFIAPLVIFVAFALGAYPIARRLTRRLGRLQSGVERLGQGDLAARVEIEGKDEVAALARSFNSAAQRIGELVAAQRLLLANCSHELRTPLARIRLAIERLSPDADSATRTELARSIAELDILIGEMLLASRLDALRSVDRAEEIDLLALTAEEAAHFDTGVEGESVHVSGDAALLRRMIRNLLDNAVKHAGGATQVRVSRRDAGRVQLVVDDAGPGVPAPDRARIFEPFYRASSARAADRGFGLGLGITRQIARAHGGDVAYEALPTGSRFTVELPAISGS
jgi:signal transduction histidine kinase